MLHQHIMLPRTGAELITYIMDNNAVEEGRRRPFVLVCPGGGYSFLSAREAEPIALRLNTLGFQAVVLRYFVAPARYPTQLHQAAEAMAYCRAHAEEWLSDPNKMAIMGFSAGGHEACSLGVFWHTLEEGEACRPNAMILSYPVISGGEHAHRGSFECLLGERHDELVDKVSLDKCVTENTPPTFLWHTWEDQLVPVENSLLLACALRKNGIPCEMHIYQKGVHGLSLSNEEVYSAADPNMRPECRGWIDMAARWFKSL